MKSCQSCGASASDNTLRCANCRAFLIAPPFGARSAAPATSDGPTVAVPNNVSTESAWTTTATAVGNDLLPRRAPVAEAPAPRTADDRELLPRPSVATPPARDGSVLHELPLGRLVAAGCALVLIGVVIGFWFGRAHSASSPPTGSTTQATSGTKSDAHASMTAAQRTLADRATESDLRNALTAEKVIYIDQQAYGASTATLRSIDPRLDWGKRLHVAIGDAATRGDHAIVCLTETSRSGATFAVADVARGPNSGTHYGRRPCPTPLTTKAVAQLGTSFAATH
jgi:hypothetical protein